MAQHLIVQTAFVGDLYLSIPLIKNIRKQFPNDSLWLLCRKGLGSSFVQLGLVDHIVEVDKKTKGVSAYQSLKKENFDIIFCPHRSFRSAWLVARLRAKTKIGFRYWWNSSFFDIRLPYNRLLPDALRQLSLLTPINADFKTQFDELSRDSGIHNSQQRTTILKWPREIPEWASMTLPELAEKSVRERSIVLAPGSVWNTKRWTPEGFSRLGQILTTEGYQVKLIGSPDEFELCEQIAKSIPGSQNFAGKKSLYESLKLLSTSEALVTNDSGAMHLAAAAGTPTVSVFGPTTLDIGYRPWNNRSSVVQIDLNCRPCGLHGGKVCPIGTHQCMKDISAEMVHEALISLLR